MKLRGPALTLLAGGALVVAACSSDTAGSPPSTTSATPAGITAAEKAAVAATYADLVYQSYDASVASATKLQAALEAFVAQPTEANLEAAKQQWLTARDDYGPTEAFRFYDGPIDDGEEGLEGRINAWPMDEAYVDYVEGNPTAGIVNDPAGFPTIDKDVLISANEQGGETNISTGWHAIEFLLWGQDGNDDGPGQRPVSDYTTAPNADRRATYLTQLGELLVGDLTSVREAWTPNGGGYRADFLRDPDLALASMLRGIGALSAGELAGERMAVAYETKDQEDEHSCFSDNTNADVRNNALGVQRVYLAELPGLSGASLSSLVAKVDPALDTRLRSELAASVKMASELPMPFEQLIRGADTDPGRTALLNTIKAVETQGLTIASAAKALGLTINLEV